MQTLPTGSILHFLRLLFLGFAVSAVPILNVGCARQTEPPPIEKHFDQQELEECKKIHWAVKNLSQQSVRDMVTCLNGKQKILQPIQDLVSSLSDVELQTLVTGYNNYYATDSGVEKTFQWFRVLRDQKQLPRFLKDVEILAKTKVLSQFVRLWAATPNRENYFSLINHLLNGLSNQLSNEPRALADQEAQEAQEVWWSGFTDTFASISAQKFALAITDEKMVEGFNSKQAAEQILDLIADNRANLDTVFSDKTKLLLQNIFSSSPTSPATPLVSSLVTTLVTTLVTSLVTSLVTTEQWAAFFAELSRQPNSPKSYMHSIQTFMQVQQKPIVCFANSPSQFQLPQLFTVILSEHAKGDVSQDQLNQKYLKTYRMLFAMLAQSCQLAPAMLESIDQLTGVIELGHVKPVNEILKAFYNANLSSEVQTFTQKKSFATTFQLFESLHQKQSLVAGVDWAKESFQQVSFWQWWNINQTAYKMERQSAEELLRIWSVPGPGREAASQLIQNIAASMQEPNGGVGDFLQIVKDTKSLSLPIAQNFILSVLRDPKFFKEWNQMLDQLLVNANLYPAIDFLGDFTKSGNFERLIQFLLEITPSSGDISNTNFIPVKSISSNEWHKAEAIPTLPINSYLACEDFLNKSQNQSTSHIADLTQCWFADSAYSQAAQNLSKMEVDLQPLHGLWNACLSEIPHFVQRSIAWVQIFTQQSLHDLVSKLNAPVSSEFWIRLEQLEKKIGTEILQPQTEILFSDALQISALPLQREFVQTFANAWQNHPEKYSYQTQMPVYISTSNTALLKEFKERGPNYLYRQVNPDLWLAGDSAQINYLQLELKSYIQLLLQNNNLANFFNSLNAGFNQKKDLAKFFRYLTQKQSVIDYWVDEEENPQSRVVTLLDQMELLVQNASISVAHNIPVFGVDHLGMYIFIELAKSDDPLQTINDQKEKLELGITYASFIGDLKKRNQLINIRNNLSAFEELVQSDYYPMIDKILKSIYANSPYSLRNEQDPHTNPLGMLLLPLNDQLFTRLQPSLLQLSLQPQSSQNISDLLLQLTNWNLREQKMFSLKLEELIAPLETTTAESRLHGSSVLDYVISKIMMASDLQKQSYGNFALQYLFLIKEIPSAKYFLLKLPLSYENLNPWLNQNISDGFIYRYLREFHYASSNQKQAVANRAQWLVEKNGPSHLSVWSNWILQHPEELSSAEFFQNSFNDSLPNVFLLTADLWGQDADIKLWNQMVQTWGMHPEMHSQILLALSRLASNGFFINSLRQLPSAYQTGELVDWMQVLSKYFQP